MTTPQSTFSEANAVATQTTMQISQSTACSIYCADCLRGRHFETRSREWVCPECNRHIVLD
jgi:Zn finger protein HypA/HybF involved in hydrogenase expression